MTIKIVTDSTCDMPPALLQAFDITVVPVYINIDGESYREGVDITRQQFYNNLYGYREYPTTAAPATGTFSRVYEDLTEGGATEILSLHVSSQLSATLNAARLGAEAADSAPVTIFDTQQITMGSGLLVRCAAEAAAAGHAMSEIVTMLRTQVPRTYVFGMIETLESLRRSGRVNWAEFGIGSLLQIKPILMIHGGEITVRERVRTRRRSQKHLLELVRSLQPFSQLVAIHANAPEAAAVLVELAGPLFPEHPPLISRITPAIGLHLGVGAVGFACITADDKVLD